VLVKTVQQWDQAGLITVVRMIDNQRRIPTSITRLTRGIGQPRCVIYARVSSSRQEQAGNLERQTDRLHQTANTRGHLLVETIAEQASSLNEKRRGMKKLFSLSSKRKKWVWCSSNIPIDWCALAFPICCKPLPVEGCAWRCSKSLRNRNRLPR
jgi:predicted site-specific integrase-resolvase